MKKVVVCCLAVLFGAMSAQAAVPKINTQSSKYAAFVLDADTGEVFYARNADKKRYPASLTKMMTLYMTFDALKQGKIALNDRLPVSKRAASQPQTNISLKTGQTIPVRDAIKALVVRSANDVAVVLAEKLGKTERNFTIEMTRKARALGMKATQFRNPHGLPDRQQFTTARDMAKLSIALRRDFPQYYHYFKTTKFSWKGKTYKSHNHVLSQFDGVDGIKTGYINMSGFNLATSVKRDGYHLVAVVMGGQTGRSRDAHMVSLLTKSFTTIAKRGDQPRAFASAPVPTPKPAIAGVPVKTASVPWLKVSFSSQEQADAQNKPAAVKAPVAASKAVAASPLPQKAKDAAAPKQLQASASQPATTATQATPEAKKSFFRFVSAPSTRQAEPNTLNFQLASLQNHADIRQKWGIQVGAFRDAQSALQAANSAKEVAQHHLRHSKINISDHNATDASIHRARLANLSEKQAKRACDALAKRSTPCFVFKLENAQNL